MNRTNPTTTLNVDNTKKLLDDFIREIITTDSTPYNFNLLDEQCGRIVENSHTNILMRLLQYKNKQYGYVFLENFFKYLGISIYLNQYDVIFDQERFTEGNKKNGRMDGFVYQKDNFALIIENKINHANPTDLQIQTYIEDITNESKETHITSDKIWVLYLTLDGSDKPQDSDVDYMREKKICSEKSGNDEIQGERYFAVNYHDDILPWLKDEIHPIVMQRDLTLNAGLIQYIDFLEGMFGKRHQDIELLRKSEDWKRMLIEKIKPSENLIKKNRQLSDVISHLKDIQKDLKKDTEESKRKHYAAGILISIMEEINKEPMRAFFNTTYRYFREIIKMEECVVRHRFDYCYIQIRKASWPTNIHFEWYPLGIERLSVESENRKYRLCFHVEGRDESYRDGFKQIKGLLDWKEEKQNRIYFYKEIELGKSILVMSSEELKDFLHKAYKDITPEIIESIDKIISSKEQKQHI